MACELFQFRLSFCAYFGDALLPQLRLAPPRPGNLGVRVFFVISGFSDLYFAV